MLENFLYVKQKDLFIDALEAGEVLDEAVVFIEDTKEIWNHGTYFDGSKVDLSKLEEAISKIKTDGDGLMYLNDKGEYEIPQIIVDSEEELNSITPEIGTRAVVRNIVEGYDNLNLAEILNGEETNVPADLFDAGYKYAFKVTSVDTSIQFPYQEDDEHTVYELFTQNGFEKFEIVTNQDGSSISRVHINSSGTPLIIYNGYGQEFYWHDHTIVERIITIDNIMAIANLGQNVVDAFLLFSTALNVSIITNRDYTDYYYTSKGWVQSDYITTQQFLMIIESLFSTFDEQIPTKLSQLENDANYIQDNVISDGVYAVNANGKLIDYNTADATALGVALVAGEHKFMIAKSDATNGTNTTLYWGKNLYRKDVAGITNTSGSGYIGEGKTYGTDFTTWSTGPVVDFNGAANTAAIIAGYTEHGVSMDARDMCSVLNTFNASDSNNDWYVPACGQLALMYLNMTEINAALAKIGGTALALEGYWSSSEASSLSAWTVDFINGYVCDGNDYYGKDYDCRVRFVRDISVPTLKERITKIESQIGDINTILESIING